MAAWVYYEHYLNDMLAHLMIYTKSGIKIVNPAKLWGETPNQWS